MYQLWVYVPQDYLEPMKEALFRAGAGRIGNYDRCCWQVKGQGQFRPQSGSDAFVGELGEVERVDEYKLELVCAAEIKSAIKRALLDAHPYEEPAYGFFRFET